MANLKLTLAAALLCGSAALAVPAFANGDHAAGNDTNMPAASSTQSNASQQDANQNDQANDENSNDESASNDEDNNDRMADRGTGGEHGLSTPEEKQETATLNQAQVAANGNQGNARSGITRSTMGESRGGVSSGTPTSMHEPAPANQNQGQDQDQSDSNDANGGAEPH